MATAVNPNSIANRFPRQVIVGGIKHKLKYGQPAGGVEAATGQSEIVLNKTLREPALRRALLRQIVLVAVGQLRGKVAGRRLPGDEVLTEILDEAFPGLVSAGLVTGVTAAQAAKLAPSAVGEASGESQAPQFDPEGLVRTKAAPEREKADAPAPDGAHAAADCREDDDTK